MKRRSTESPVSISSRAIERIAWQLLIWPLPLCPEVHEFSSGVEVAKLPLLGAPSHASWKRCGCASELAYPVWRAAVL